VNWFIKAEMGLHEWIFYQN